MSGPSGMGPYGGAPYGGDQQQAGPYTASDAIAVSDVAVLSGYRVAAQERLPGTYVTAGQRTRRNPVNVPRTFRGTRISNLHPSVFQSAQDAVGAITDSARISAEHTTQKASDSFSISDAAKLTGLATHLTAADLIAVSDQSRAASGLQPTRTLQKLTPGIGARATPLTRNPVNSPRYFKKQIPRPPPSYSFAGADTIPVSDAATRAAVAEHGFASDSIAVSDKAAITWAVADAISISDAVSFTSSVTHSADVISISDTARALNPQTRVIETVFVHDAAKIVFYTGTADVITFHDAASAITFFAAFDAFSVSDAVRGRPSHVYGHDTITVKDVAPDLGFDTISVSDSAQVTPPFFSAFDHISISDVATAVARSDAFVYQMAQEVAFRSDVTRAIVYGYDAEIGYRGPSRAEIYHYGTEIGFAPTSKAEIYHYAVELSYWKPQTGMQSGFWPEHLVFFDRMASRLSVQVETKGGVTYRWGPDEWQVQNVYQDLSFSTVMPGGFEQMTLTLNRDPKILWPDFEAFAKVSVLAPGGKIVWQGRLESFPETAGEQDMTAVTAVGGQAYLDDNNAAAMIYVDQNLSTWQGPSVFRQLTLANFLSSSTANPWKPGVAVQAGQVCRPTSANGFLYITDQGGTSGSKEPTWPTTIGHTVKDGSVTWSCLVDPPPTNLTPSTGIAWQQQSTNVAADPTDQPALIAEIDDSWASPTLALVEAWYDAQDTNGIAKVYYSFFYPNLGTDQATDKGGITDADWHAMVSLSNDSNASVDLKTTGNFFSTSNNRVSGYFAPGGTYRWASIDWFNSTSGGMPGGMYWSYWRLAVYGPHGLPLYGSDPKGVLASDVVAHAIRTWCPDLNYTTGINGSIQTSVYIIPQLTFTPTTTSQIIKGAVVYEMLDWAVWEDFTFYLNPRGARGKKWYVQSGPAHLQSAGPQVSKIWNGVIVTYTDVDGFSYSVGPPGSGCDYETPYLVDNNPKNPANQAGLKKWAPLQMNTATKASAIATGQIFLQEQFLVNTSGSATLTGYVQDDAGIYWPTWMVRAGDQISFVDASDTSFRRIVHTQYSAIDAKVTIQLDQPPDSMDALLQRLSASLAAYGLS